MVAPNHFLIITKYICKVLVHKFYLTFFSTLAIGDAVRRGSEKKINIHTQLLRFEEKGLLLMGSL